MKVKDLIKQLQMFSPELELIVSYEPDNMKFRLISVNDFDDVYFEYVDIDIGGTEINDDDEDDFIRL